MTARNGQLPSCERALLSLLVTVGKLVLCLSWIWSSPPLFAQALAPTTTPSPLEDRSVRIVANQGHTERVEAFGISTNNQFGASVAGDETVRIWDVATGRLIKTFVTEPETRLVHVALSPDGKHVVVGSSGYIGRGYFALIEIDTGATEVERLENGQELAWLAWSKDGRWMGGALFDRAKNQVTVTVTDTSSTDTSDWQERTKRSFPWAGNASGKLEAAFSNDSRHIVLVHNSEASIFSRRMSRWSFDDGILRSVTVEGEELTIASNTDQIAVKRHQSIDIFSMDVFRETSLTVRSLPAHTDVLRRVFFSTDGKSVYAFDQKNVLVGWHVVGGSKKKAPVHKAAEKQVGDFAVHLGKDGQFIALSKEIEVRDLNRNGEKIRTFGHAVDPVSSVVPSKNLEEILISGGGSTLRLWNLVEGKQSRRIDDGKLQNSIRAVRLTSNGKQIMAGHQNLLARMLDFDSSHELVAMPDTRRPFTPHEERSPHRSLWEYQAGVDSLAFAFDMSPDGTLVARGRNDGAIKVHSTSSGKLVTAIPAAHESSIMVIAFSPDGGTLLSGSLDKKIKLWDTSSWRLIKTLEGHTWAVRSAAFLPGGKELLTGSGDLTIIHWDLASGQARRKIEAHSGVVRSLEVSVDGKLAVSGSTDFEVKIWEVMGGKLLHTLRGHTGEVESVAITADARRVVSGSADGTLKVWSTTSGALLATLVAGKDGQWLAMTPEGFFASSRNGGAILTILRGRDLTTIDQVHQSLYNPDLVREALAGDPTGEVRAAADLTGLEKVLASGPAPSVTITSQAAVSQSAKDLIKITAHVADAGKGIGRIEWRVNGVTAAVSSRPDSGGREYTVSRNLALDPGDNTIEVVAYNAGNLLASLPARTTIKYSGPRDQAKPTLHVLAIGIDKYIDQGWTPPGGSGVEKFGPLTLAAKGAEALAKDLERATDFRYAGVKVMLALDGEATRESLQRIIGKLSTQVQPRDTFIFFAGAHGTSHNGRFYLIPQDYSGGMDPVALDARAISQDMLQDWFANRIKAKKAVILLDTCESGALIAGHLRSRVAASEAGVGRLHEATGRPVLTAAALGQDAWEGLIAQSGERHGVFTWALLDALRHGDSNNNGMIELSELAAHAQARVSKAEFKGFMINLPLAGRQTVRFGYRGEDFALVKRLQ